MLYEIVYYIENESKSHDVAYRFSEELVELCKKLAFFPLMGSYVKDGRARKKGV